MEAPLFIQATCTCTVAVRSEDRPPSHPRYKILLLSTQILAVLILEVYCRGGSHLIYIWQLE